MRNEEIAEMFDTLANLLEFKGENPFRLNAYRKAARVLRDLTEDVEMLAREGRLRELPGIGEGIEKKIVQALITGKMEKFEEAMKGVPPGIDQMMEIPGVGPRRSPLSMRSLALARSRDWRRPRATARSPSCPAWGRRRRRTSSRPSSS